MPWYGPVMVVKAPKGLSMITERIVYGNTLLANTTSVSFRLFGSLKRRWRGVWGGGEFQDFRSCYLDDHLGLTPVLIFFPSRLPGEVGVWWIYSGVTSLLLPLPPKRCPKEAMNRTESNALNRLLTLNWGKGFCKRAHWWWSLSW